MGAAIAYGIAVTCTRRRNGRSDSRDRTAGEGSGSMGSAMTGGGAGAALEGGRMAATNVRGEWQASTAAPLVCAAPQSSRSERPQAALAAPSLQAALNQVDWRGNQVCV